MNGSPSSIVMFGLGNGTFNGSPSLLITRGLGIGEAGSPKFPVSSLLKRIGNTSTLTRDGMSRTLERNQ